MIIASRLQIKAAGLNFRFGINTATPTKAEHIVRLFLFFKSNLRLHLISKSRDMYYTGSTHGYRRKIAKSFECS
jgi:hypothetical protein